MAKRKSNKLLIILLVVVLLGLLGAAIYKARSKPKGEEVQTEKVQLRTISETVTASGKVFPEKEVKISSDVSGEIVELYVEEGDSVKTGQLLAKIDPEVYVSAVERGEATLNNAKSNLAIQEASAESNRAQIEQIQVQLMNARQIHERNVELYKEGVISLADFESSEANLNQLEANLKSAKANLNAALKSAEAAKYSVKSADAALKELTTNLNRTTIASPTDGIVSKLNVEQGERVVGTIQMTGTEMMRIANFNSMEVQVEVSENDILRVAVGDSVDIEVDAYLDKIFKGSVTEIANSAANTSVNGQVVLTSDQVTNFIVKIRIKPESYASLLEETELIPFRPGMSASVDIFTDLTQDAMTVPIQAVTTRDFSKLDRKEGEKASDSPGDEDEREVVFVVESDTVRMAEVATGIQDNEFIEIVSGLDTANIVVTGPYSAISRKLESGDAVTIAGDKKGKKGKKDEVEE